MGWDKTQQPEAKAVITPKVIKPEEYFRPAREIPIRKGLKIGLAGAPGVGKSFFIGTCPGPIYWIDNELAAQKLWFEHFSNRNDVHIYEVKVFDPITDDPDPLKCLDNFENAVRVLKNVDVGTVGVDTVSSYWDWMSAYVDMQPIIKDRKDKTKTYHFDWGAANERYMYFIMRLLSLPCTVVLTAQNRRPFKDRDTNQIVEPEPRWQWQTPHWVDVSFEIKPFPRPDGGTVYKATAEKSRYTRIEGLEVEDMTYEKLVNALAGKNIKVALEIQKEMKK